MGEYNGVVGGVSSIVTDGFQPWWAGIDGTIEFDTIESMTARQAYDNALNWQVELHDIYTKQEIDGEIFYLPIVGKKATVKTDDGAVLGVVSDSFGVTQNDVVLEFVEALKTHADVQVKSAGSLFGFRQVWMLAKLGEDKHFADGDETLQKYFLVASGHDGSLSLSGRATNVRVECMNTFDWAINGTRSIVNLRHTTNIGDRLEDAKRTIKAAYNHWDKLDEEIEQLMRVEFSRTRYQDSLVPALCGKKPEDEGRALTNWEKKRDGLVASYERPDQRNIAGTGWGAVMAVNSYENWGVTVRGARAEAQAKRAVKGDFPLTSQAKELVLA